MTNKQIIINAIKEMDIIKLYELLDDERSYMDVSKTLFLEKLKTQFDNCKKNEVTSFEKLTSGVCDSCNKGCKAYRFITNDNQTLDLFFEEENDEVTDIYLCNKLDVNDKITPNYQIHFDFYEDEKVAFIPSIDFLINKQKIESALNEFHQFKNNIVSIEDIRFWKMKHAELLNEFDINPFRKKYLEFKNFEEVIWPINSIVKLLDKKQFAVQALSELEAVENEEELVYWLFTYKRSHLSNYSFKRLKNWEQNGFITFEDYPSITIDCSSCLESLKFSFLYYKYHDELIEKYNPTKEHFEKSNGGIIYSLENHLRIHGIYLDILPEENK